MSFDQLLRLLVMLLAFGVFAGGALAAQPIVDDGAPVAVFAEGDDGDDEGEGEDEEGKGELAPTSEEVDDEETDDDKEGDDGK